MTPPPGLRLPAHMVERARALVLGTSVDGGQLPDWVVPPLRDAATVVMVSDTSEGLHVYLQRRVRSMAFAAGMYVFPGGAVDDQDRAHARQVVDSLPTGTLPSQLLTSSQPDAGRGQDTLAARVAAVREVAEEASHDLADPMALSYIAHWVTPEVEDRRYDTRFYAVVLPVRDSVIESSGESDHERWLRPADALAEYSAGRMAMLPPTVSVLSEFAEAVAAGSDAQAAIASLARRPIVPIMPAPVADPSSEIGIRWALVDIRDGSELQPIASPPAGSETHGVSGIEE